MFRHNHICCSDRKLTDEAHQLEITDAFKMLHSELWNGDDYREGSGVGLSFSCVSGLGLALILKEGDDFSNASDQIKPIFNKNITMKGF